jgi:steroid delta-isomerase-like uncharacterized protein
VDGKYDDKRQRKRTAVIREQNKIRRRKMSLAENKALIRHFYELSNQGKDVAAIEEIAAPQDVCHSSFGEMSVDQLKQFCATLNAAVPDMHTTIEHIVAEGDLVTTYYTMSGTPQKPMMGIPPTGKSFSMKGVGVYKIVGGKIVEQWSLMDVFSLLTQLGVLLNVFAKK